jgi:hypothetical protein
MRRLVQIAGTSLVVISVVLFYWWVDGTIGLVASLAGVVLGVACVYWIERG